jgi:hypothetical protein
MKILLIQPPVEDFYQTSLRTLPVGLLYLAASLRCAGIDVEILDCQATMHKHVLPVPPEFTYLKRYLIIPNWQISSKILKLLKMRHENASSASRSNRIPDSGGA